MKIVFFFILPQSSLEVPQKKEKASRINISQLYYLMKLFSKKTNSGINPKQRRNKENFNCGDFRHLYGSSVNLM